MKTDFSGNHFPLTHWSAISAARSDDSDGRNRALGLVIAAYWKPVYKYIRLRWSKPPEDAQDLTQAFFTQLIEKDLLRRFDPERARFRTYLRLCVDGFLANEYKAEHRLKRGGSAVHLSLDFDNAESEVPLSSHPSLQSMESIEEWFAKESARSLFGVAVDKLREQCLRHGKALHFQLFEIYDLGEGECSYSDLAAKFDLPVTDVTNYLSTIRRQFRSIVLQTLREMCGSDAEFRSEARKLLGIEPS